MDKLSLTSEHEEAIRKYELLKDALARFEQEKEEFLFHIKPNLESLYLSLVGKLKIELLSIQTEVYFLKRKLEMIQTCVNQGKDVLLEVIEELVKKEMKDHYDHLNEEAKKVEAAFIILTSEKLSTEEEKEFKKLYYKLAKILHPDLNPDLTNEEIILWQDVSDAYRNGDLPKMRLLEILVEEKRTDQNRIMTTFDELKIRISKVSQYIEKLMRDIDKIKNNIPFTLVDNLNNPQWVVDENNNSLNSISKAMDEKDYYKKAIAVLTETIE